MPTLRRKTLTATAVTVVVLVVAGYLASWYFGTRRFHALSVVLVGVVTFFGFLLAEFNEDQTHRLSERGIRIAITAAAFVAYVTLVGTAVFYSPQVGDLPPVAQTLLTSFTTIVGVVMAFYFGASAYVESRDGKSKNE